jgi:hypothetical protein
VEDPCRGVDSNMVEEELFGYFLQFHFFRNEQINVEN